MPSPRTLAEIRAELEEAERRAASEAERPIGPRDHLPAGLVPTTAKGWKNKLGTPQPLELPSGNVCLVVRPGLPNLLKEGVLPDLMSPLAEKAIKAVDQDEANKEIDNSMRDLMARPD